jgi:predicted phage tail component-like protein
MAGISLVYNGIDLSQWFDVTDVQRNIGTSHVNSMTKIGQSDGQFWQYMTRDTKTITISGIVTNANLVNLRRDLGAALDVDEPKQLIVGDDADVYYLAIYDGQPTFAEDWRGGTISLSFIVPDGIAHSLTVQTFDNVNTDGTLNDELIIQNNGTYPVYPIIEVTMHSDNGYVGLASSNGSYLEFGNPEEVDGVIKQKSEKALWEGYDIAPKTAVINSKFASLYPNFLSDPNKPNAVRGSIGYADTVGLDPNKGSGAIPTFINDNNGYWGGPTLYMPIAPNSNGKGTGNFLMKTRFYFATNTKQMGRLEFSLQSGDQVAYQFIVRDSSSVKDEIIVEFWAQDEFLDEFSLNRKQYTNGLYRELTIGKLGSKVTMQLGAVTQVKADNTATIRSTIVRNYNLDYMAGVDIDGYGFWFEQYKNTDHAIMDVTDTKFQWVNVDYWADIPNRFASGDVVTIDTAQRKVYVNGVEDMTLQTIGNQWDRFSLKPGETTIESVASSWANSPTVKISFQEAYV